MLSRKQVSEYRAKAHHLKPVVIIGQNGLTDNVLSEIDTALNAHELIKVKVAGDDREQRMKWADMLCEGLDAQLIQTIGKIIILYRQKPDLDKN